MEADATLYFQLSAVVRENQWVPGRHHEVPASHYNLFCMISVRALCTLRSTQNQGGVSLIQCPNTPHSQINITDLLVKQSTQSSVSYVYTTRINPDSSAIHRYRMIYRTNDRAVD